MLRRHFSPYPLPSTQIQALVFPYYKCSTHIHAYLYFCTVSSHNLLKKFKSLMSSHCYQRQQSFTWPVTSCLVLAICPSISSGTRHLPSSLHCSQTLAILQFLVHIYFPFSPGFVLAVSSDDFFFPCFT